MTLPEFFYAYTDTLPRPVALAIGSRGDVNFDLMSLEAAARPAPFRLDERISKNITEKALGKAYPVVEISFGAPGPDPLLKQGILNLGNEGINVRSNPDVEGVIASYITGKKGSIEQQKKQLGSRRRKTRKSTRRRRTNRRR